MQSVPRRNRNSNDKFMDTDIKNCIELERLKFLQCRPPDLSIREIPTKFISKINLAVEGKSESSHRDKLETM